jgi:serine/threonine protein phosphatase PrpC
MKLTVGTVTDRGLNPRRTLNEDRLLALPDQRLFVVCDGVGGHNSGEVASETVVERLFTAIQTQSQAQLNGDKEHFIDGTLQQINRELFTMSNSDAELHGMATTVALVWIDDASALIAHVGDSRVYRFTRGGLIQETTDHTVVEDAIRAGQMTEGEAAQHPMKHVINRAMGIESEVEPEFSTVRLEAGDTFLLCSDGITGHLTSDELASLLGSKASPQQICDEFKEVCYERGADDNLTAVVVRIDSLDHDDEPTHQKARKKGKAGGTQVFKQSRVTTPLPKASQGDKSTTRITPGTAKITVPVGTNVNNSRSISNSPRVDSAGQSKSGATEATGHLSKRILMAFVIVALVGAAFYVGMRFDQQVTKNPQSVPTFADVPAVNPTADQAFNSGALAFNKTDWAAASESFATAAKNNPQRGEYYYWSARAKFEQGQYRDALSSFERALSLNFKGTKGSALLYKALCQSALRLDEEAQKTFRAYATERTNPQQP